MSRDSKRKRRAIPRHPLVLRLPVALHDRLVRAQRFTGHALTSMITAGVRLQLDLLERQQRDDEEYARLRREERRAACRADPNAGLGIRDRLRDRLSRAPEPPAPDAPEVAPVEIVIAPPAPPPVSPAAPQAESSAAGAFVAGVAVGAAVGIGGALAAQHLLKKEETGTEKASDDGERVGPLALFGV